MTPNGRASRSLRSISYVGAVVGALCLASLARMPGNAPWIVAGSLVIGNVVLVRWAVPRQPAARATERWVIVLLAAAWVAITLVPMHDFTNRSPADAVSAVSVQTAGELALFGLVGAFAVYLLRSYVVLVPVGIGLTALPVWMIASASWGLTPAYALARGAEFAALIVLASATAGLGVRGRRRIDELVTTTLRWLAWAAVGLVVAGFVLGPLYVVVTPSNRDRFTWIAAHPTESGFILGTTLLILVSISSEQLRMRPWVRITAVAVTTIALYENQTRTVLAGLALGGALLLVTKGRRRPDAAALSGFFIVGGSILAVLAAGGALGDYILRGDDSSRLTTLNGRNELWGIGFEALDGPMAWLHGLGYGSTRFVFVEEAKFAGNAHNSVLGMLVSLGLVGVALLFLAVGKAVLVLWRSGIVSRTEYGPTLAALLAYSLVAAVTTDNLVEPHFGIVFLYLCVAVTVGWSTAGGGLPEPERAPVPVAAAADGRPVGKGPDRA